MVEASRSSFLSSYSAVGTVWSILEALDAVVFLNAFLREQMFTMLSKTFDPSLHAHRHLLGKGHPETGLLRILLETHQDWKCDPRPCGLVCAPNPVAQRETDQVGWSRIPGVQ